MFRTFLLFFAALGFEQTLAAQKCPGIDQRLTPARRALYAPLTAEKAGGESVGKPVHVASFMSMDNWVAVFATPYNAERGVFFFDTRTGKPIARDVWGGVSAGSPAKEIADWTKTVDPTIPRALALCFARAVVAGR